MRAKLTALQREPTLANRAPVAIKDAEAAVVQAEIIEKDLAACRASRVHRRSQGRYRAGARRNACAEEERTALNEQSEKARLDSRTREADLAKSDALVARADSAEQRAAAASARSDADAALLAANASQQQAAELQRQIELLQARPTDRGLVLTLGDTLFATGKSELKSGATANLDRVTTFMNEYPKRTAAIEGFTDSMGSDEMNQSLVAAPRRCGEELSGRSGRGLRTPHFRGSRRRFPGR